MKKRPPVRVDPSDNSSDYRNKLSEQDKLFIERFDREFSSGTGGTSSNLLIKGEAVKEANRNGNSYNRDLYTVAKRNGTLSSLDETTERFLQDACDEWDWQKEYKIHGIKAARKMILDQTKANVLNSKLDIEITLSRFFEQMYSLLKEYNYDRNQKRKHK